MSGSPKYTTVRVSAARAQRVAAAAARRAAARRERAAARAAQLRARQARLRQQQDQREQARRQREAEQVAQALGDQRRVLATGLAELRALVTQLRTAPGAADAAIQTQLTGVDQDLAGLATEISSGTDVARYREQVAALRSRTLAVQQEVRGTERAVGRPAIVASLRERLAAARTAAGPAGEDGIAAEFGRCDQMLGELAAAADETEGVRFEVLHGTAEHAVARAEQLAADTARAAEAARFPAEAARTAPAGTPADGADSVDGATAELSERLAVLRDPVVTASSDAATFEDFALRDQLDRALREAETALAAGRADAALAAVTQLEKLLPTAEERLDGLLAAHERRGELAEALRDVLAGQGMTFLGGDAAGSQVQMRFERPSGAVYTTTIGSDTEGGVVLSYAIDGEPDIRVPTEAGAGQPVCDQTEAFLTSIHQTLARNGFDVGELWWDGKPSPKASRPLPSSSSTRTTPR